MNSPPNARLTQSWARPDCLTRPAGRERGHAKAPQRAIEDENQAKQQEGCGFVRRIRGHELRQEGQKEQRHLRIERVGQCALPKHQTQ
jgi:hypothetical protein